MADVKKRVETTHSCHVIVVYHRSLSTALILRHTPTANYSYILIANTIFRPAGADLALLDTFVYLSEINLKDIIKVKYVYYI